LGDKDGVVRIFDRNKNSLLNEFKAHTNRIIDIKYSPDGKLLATASYDWTIKLWETSDFNNPPFLLDDHGGWVVSIDFSPDGKYLISGGGDKKIILWPTKSKDMAEGFCKIISRNLTEEEWATYVAKDIPYEKTCLNIE